jgi:hypothetical protein
MNVDRLAAARAQALFAARVNAEPLSRAAATSAIRAAVRACGGVRGCADVVAAEFGDHPEVAVVRMRWARATVAALFPARGGRVPAGGLVAALGSAGVDGPGPGELVGPAVGTAAGLGYQVIQSAECGEGLCGYCWADVGQCSCACHPWHVQPGEADDLRVRVAAAAPSPRSHKPSARDRSCTGWLPTRTVEGGLW